MSRLKAADLETKHVSGATEAAANTVQQEVEEQPPEEVLTPQGTLLCHGT